MSHAGELFLSATPAFPDNNTGDYLGDNENNDEFSQVISEECGDDETEPKRGWNHEGREEPKLSAGAGDKRVAIEKHNRLKGMFDSDRAKWELGITTRGLSKRAGLFAHPTVSQWCASVYLLINGANWTIYLSQTNR